MNLNEKIHEIVYFSEIPIEEGIGSLIFGLGSIAGKNIANLFALFKFSKLLSILKLMKGSGAVILPNKTKNIEVIDPNKKSNNKFKDEIKFYTKSYFYSVGISTALNQITGMFFVDQKPLNIMHVYTAIEIFFTLAVFGVFKKVIEKFKNKPLTRNQQGVLITTLVGSVIFLSLDYLNNALEEYNIKISEASIYFSMFLTFILNTDYIGKFINIMIQKLSKTFSSKKIK